MAVEFHKETLAKVVRPKDLQAAGLIDTPSNRAFLSLSAFGVVRSDFSGLLLRPMLIKDKVAYSVSSVPHAIVLNQLNQVIRRSTGLKASDRDTIVRRLVTVLSEGVPHRLYKFDIKEFFDSIDKRLLADEILVDYRIPRASAAVLAKYLNEVHNRGIRGLPRGIPLSATLAEYAMRQSTILAVRFFRQKVSEYADEICEIIRLLVEDITSNPSLQNVSMSEYVPIEVLNIVLASSELPGEYQTNVRAIRERALRNGRIDYFTIVSLLFYFRHSDANFVARLEGKIIQDFLPKASPRIDSHDAHFIMDLIACPYIDVDVRKQLLGALMQSLGIPGIADLTLLVNEIEINPWFVNWKQIDLLNHLRKKELSSVY